MAKKTTALLRAAAAEPWMLQPEKLDAVFTLLEMHARGERYRPEEIRARVGAPKAKTSATIQPSAQKSVAVLPLYGVLTQRASSLQEMSGATSTERFAQEFQALVDNPNVSAIVLNIDSPGGSTAGIPEAAALIRQARETKPVYAIANALMASAGYYLGAQATEVIASPSALVGSVGVYMIHYDDSALLDQEGLDRTVISAGAHKAEGIGPLDDPAKAHLQSIVDDTYAMMLNDIGHGRGLSATAVEENYGQGRVFTANQALDAGLVDRIASLDELLSELTAEQPPSTRGARAAITHHRIAATADPPLTETQLDSLVSALRSEGFFVPAAATGITGLTASAGSPRLVLTPSTAAPKAKEPTVPDKPENTTAQPGATSDPNVIALQQEMARREAIDQLCALAGATVAEANAFKASNKTAEQVRVELAANMKAPIAIGGSAIRVGADREAEKPFGSLGEQLMAIAQAGMGMSIDKRLLHINAAATGGSANVPSDGSFLIQKDYSAELSKEAFNEGTVMADCSVTEISANSDGLLVHYIDETSRATGSRWGGVQIYRGAEADSATAKKPKLGEWECRVYDLIGLAYMTERLLRDASAMESVYREAFTAEFAFVGDDEVIRGTGAAQMLGLVNSPALVSVAKETGQLADTVVAENIINMWARLIPRAKANAVWYVNQEVEPLLQTMQIGTGASGQLVYMAPGGLSGNPFGTIYGRPVKVVEQCSAKGDVGDIILADLSGYKIVTKDGLQADDSIHVRFINNERTFRWIKRIGGAPKMKSAITPYKGNNTLSDHVALAAR